MTNDSVDGRMCELCWIKDEEIRELRDQRAKLLALVADARNIDRVFRSSNKCAGFLDALMSLRQSLASFDRTRGEP